MTRRDDKRTTPAASHSVKGRSSYVLYRLVWKGARRPPPDPDARRPDGADRPRTAPPAQLLVEGSGAGSGRHHPAHLQGCTLIDPAAQIMPEPAEAALWKAGGARWQSRPSPSGRQSSIGRLIRSEVCDG